MKIPTVGKLLALAVIIFFIKGGISLFIIKGPSILPTEACVIQKAIHFSESLDMEACRDILRVDAEDVSPLYPLLISIVYFFTKGALAYRIVLLLNSLIIVGLIFPLYFILRREIGDGRMNFVYAAFLLFIPPVIIFEYAASPEILFFAMNVWFIYFYLNSFGKQHAQIINKVIAILLVIASILCHPLGFVVLIAMIANELFSESADRKNVACFYIPFAVILMGIGAFRFVPDIISQISAVLLASARPPYATAPLDLLKNQFYLLFVAAGGVPFILLLLSVLDRRTFFNSFGKIKNFFITFIVFNAIVNVCIAYSDFIRGVEHDFSVKQICVSVFYLVIFALVFLIKYPGFVFNGRNFVAMGFSALAGSFFILYKPNNVEFSGIHLLPTMLLIYAVLLLCFVLNEKRMAICSLCIMFLIQSVFLLNEFTVVSSQKLFAVEYFENKNARILFLEPKSEFMNIIKKPPPDYWKLLVLSRERVAFRFLLNVPSAENAVTLPSEELKQLKLQYDYLVSSLNINLKKERTFVRSLDENKLNVYKIN